MSIRTKATLVSTILASSVLISGCGLFNLETKDKIDPPKDVAYLKDASEIEKESKSVSEQVNEEQKTVMTELYLIDKNGYVVPQSMALPNTQSVAKQALEYLVQNGPVTDQLPNNFRAVLPADTEVSVNIKDGVATVDFSKQFKDYKAEDEQKIVQSITWTLTQFDNIQKVKMQITGNELTEMPVNHLPLAKEGTSRLIGINQDNSNMTDIMNSRPVTVYYLGGEEENYYYVPVTKRISNDEGDNVKAAVAALVKGPGYSSTLLSEFMPEVALLDEPKVEDKTVTLNFNDSIYSSFEEKEKMISSRLLDELVLTLTEQTGIEKVAVEVNGNKKLLNESGKELSEPVSRPTKVNTGSY